MRFTETGPSIPAELLELQQQGDIIFFCGAGVSMPQLDSFANLTENVKKKLGADTNHKFLETKKCNSSFDQVFELLKAEYGNPAVTKAVIEQLTLENPNLIQHKIVLQLSQNKKNKPLIITTNFDHLFELSDPTLKYWEAPLLPRHADLNKISGLVYLHGRLPNLDDYSKDEETYQPDLVLSSTDFGRAYLAEAWATYFIKYTLEHKTIILLGYSAEDPPVKYFLQGLKSSHVQIKCIYAFDSFDNAIENFKENVIKQKWQNLNISPILYDKNEQVGGHKNLWGTLQAWASYASDVDGWQQKTIEMAQQSTPESLKPYQRGQVAFLVSTIYGAKRFSEANPPISAEWLCVFDNQMRYAQPYKESLIDQVKIDPHQLYRLDDDPPRKINNSLPLQIQGSNLLASFPHEQQQNGDSLVCSSNNYRMIHSRLKHLLNWFISISHQETAIWWALTKQYLHPEILSRIESVINQGKYNVKTRVIWLWLLESYQKYPYTGICDDYFIWYDFLKKIEIDGWSHRNLRHLEYILKPIFYIDLTYYRSPFSKKPSSEDDLFKCIFPKLKWIDMHNHAKKFVIPDEQLGNIMAIIKRVFDYALSFYNELEFKEKDYTIYKVRLIENSEHCYDDSKVQEFFNWSISLLKKYCEVQPQQATQLINAWPNNEPYFFNTLKLYIALNTNIFDAEKIAKIILLFDSDYFWRVNIQPTLLHVLKKYWSSFSDKSKLALENKIILGRKQYENIESVEEFEHYRKIQSSIRLGYLEQNSCKLSSSAQKFLDKARSIPDWDKKDELIADIPHQSGAFRVETETMDGFLEKLPLKQIIEQAELFSQFNYKERKRFEPFIGLIKAKPLKALSSLIFQQKLKKYPIQYWDQLLQNWPKEYKGRQTKKLTLLCGLRLIQLPQSEIIKFSSTITLWIDAHLSYVTDQYFDHFLIIWDSILECINNEGVVNSYFISISKVISEKDYSHALNSSMGRLTETLLKILDTLRPLQKLPDSFKQRFEKTLIIKGLGASYACSILIRNIYELYNLDSEWTINVLIPLFNLEHPLAQASWYAFMYNNKLPPLDLFKLIKNDFIRLVEKEDWLEEAGDSIQGKLGAFITAFIYENNSCENAGLTYQEGRTILQKALPYTRSQALHQLHVILNEENNWNTFGKQFLAHVWPQEERLQTSGTSEQLVHIATSLPDIFPQVVIQIIPFLKEVNNNSSLVYEFTIPQEGQDYSLVELYPLDVLKVLDKIIQTSSRMYELNTILNTIANKHPEVSNWSNWKRLMNFC